MEALKLGSLFPGMELIGGTTMHMTVVPPLITITPMDSTLLSIPSTKMAS